MSGRLEHEDFAKQLNSRFRIQTSDLQTVEAELIEVSEHLVSTRQERFSLTFRTANDFFLGQGQRPFQHDQMGEFSLFLVPIGRDEAGTYYEAIFNRLVPKR